MQQKPSDIARVQSPQALREVAIAFLHKYPEGGIFTVTGEMGAGKTTFIHAICDALGVEFQGSPTFSIVHEYALGGNKFISHFDLYRLKHSAELQDIGFEEYLDRKGYVFVEWPELAAPFFADNVHPIHIRDESGDRVISY
jgi:tRNA threonylcarbamoyladenosine biosynthesis protein TsaE